MNIEELQKICLKLKGTTQDIKWENHLCFNVGQKIYLITSPDNLPVSASFKTSDDDFISLTEREGLTPARYLARYKWVQVDNINRLTAEEWGTYIRKSYQLVFEKLPYKIKKQISENP